MSHFLAALFLAGSLSACGGGDGSRKAHPPADQPVAGPPVPRSAEKRILFIGTSLTAGFGLEPEQAYPALIQLKIDSEALGYRVLNAGVSGQTSAGALSSIGWLLKIPPEVLVIETGANDGLRGQDPDSLRANIQAIIDSARARKADMTILLVGMEAMRNLGTEYVTRFQRVYPELARANRITLIPFLLQGVAGVDSLNQLYEMHPTAEGQRIVAENVWKVLRRVLVGSRG